MFWQKWATFTCKIYCRLLLNYDFWSPGCSQPQLFIFWCQHWITQEVALKSRCFTLIGQITCSRLDLARGLLVWQFARSCMSVSNLYGSTVTSKRLVFSFSLCLSVVLSSDEEESGDAPQQRSRVLHQVLTVDKDSVLRRASSQEAVCKKQDSPDKHDAEVGRRFGRPGHDSESRSETKHEEKRREGGYFIKTAVSHDWFSS